MSRTITCTRQYATPKVLRENTALLGFAAAAGNTITETAVLRFVLVTHQTLKATALDFVSF